MSLGIRIRGLVFTRDYRDLMELVFHVSLIGKLWTGPHRSPLPLSVTVSL